MRKVILDVDTGSDDSIALMLAYLSRQLDILGVTVTWGNNSVEDCVENTLRVLDFMGAKIPVYQGCSAPIVRTLDEKRLAQNPGNAIWFEEDGVRYTIHPKVLPLPDAVSKKEEMHACSYLVETLMNSREKVTLIPVGPPTNIGMAFRMEPRIKDHVEEVVFMGGSVGMGNVTPTAEANFLHDPEAVKIILNSGVKVRIVSLNATSSAPLSMEMADEFADLKTKYGKFAHDIIKLRAKVSKHLGWTDGSAEAIHDALAVATLLDPSVILESKRYATDIICGNDPLDGTLVVKEDETSPVEIVLKADARKYFTLLKKAFENE